MNEKQLRECIDAAMDDCTLKRIIFSALDDAHDVNPNLAAASHSPLYDALISSYIDRQVRAAALAIKNHVDTSYS